MLNERWTAGILGVWLVVAAFLGLGAHANLWNDLLVGVIVGFTSFSIGVESKLEGWTVGLAGLWLVVAAFIPALRGGAGLILNDVLVGAVLAAAAFIPAGGSRLPAHTHSHS